ncbi:GPI mannosyltransferase 3 [Zootermopsis nevadensis]|uniref:GPI mannosyltransferase 3 n=1 Tax=Zootermopsis nevadensis TaxID=136037 RepID=UPI000B8E258B|nr:GPI mannosyltransferase 3 [Zootermopsis nevadensis]
MNPWLVLSFFMSIRLCMVYIVQTWFVPDEYWQTVEVAHKIVFGYGHETWEWTLGIRSYIYPAFLATILSVLKYFHLDSVNTVVHGPRILQAVLSAVGDYCFLRWYRNQNGGHGLWASFALITNWFWMYCGSRTLINTFEATLNTFALNLFPWNQNKIQKSPSKFLWFVATACMIRPTAVIIWLPLCIYHFLLSYHKVTTVVKDYILIGLIVITAGTMLDTYFYGKITFTPLHFLQANIMDSINVFYGTHPSLWYIVVGIPVVLGCHLIPFLLGAFRALTHKRGSIEMVLLFVSVWTVAVLSFVPHKEFRFLLPLFPMFVYIESSFLSHWSRKAQRSMLLVATVGMVIANIALLGYFGLIHQRGTLDVMKVLSDTNHRHTNLLFLMPCHSTPLYSHLHMRIQVRFLTCEPDFTGNPHYQDEADIFYTNPEKWLLQNYSSNDTVSHIIIYDSLYPKIKNFFNQYNYKLNRSLFHTFHPSGRVGKYVEIYTQQY